VPVRFHSPAHQLEQVENVFPLLKDHPFQFPSSIDHIDLRNLLLMGSPPLAYRININWYFCPSAPTAL
jgi:hypothetical protein